MPRQHFLALFQTALLWHNIITYNKMQYNTKTDEKISIQKYIYFSPPVHKIRLHNYFIYKNPPTPQGRDVCAIYIHLQSWEMRKTADNTAENILIFFPGALTVYFHIYIFN
jgi:hypothetical protein